MQTPFEAEQFTPTQFSTAANKAEFGNDLVKFILDGFRYGDFSELIYQKLSNCFGHIAHYNRRGFYDTWFSDAEQIGDWVKWISGTTPMGSPEHTFSDFERAFQSWMQQNLDLVATQIGAKSLHEKTLVENEGDEIEFMIVAVSANSGSFGHKEHIVIGRNGVGFKGHRQPSENAPGNRDLEKGDTFNWEVDSSGMPKSWLEWFETMDRMPDPAPQAVIDEVFG